MIQQQLMAEQQAQMQAYAAAQMAGGAPVAYYANPEQAAYMQQQALMAAGAGAGDVPEPPKRTVFGDGAGAGAGAGSSADHVPDPSLGTVVQQVRASTLAALWRACMRVCGCVCDAACPPAHTRWAPRPLSMRTAASGTSS